MPKAAQRLRAGFLVHDVSRLRRTAFDNRVIVSSKGLELVQTMNLIVMEMNTRILRGISAARQRELEDMLSKMKQNLIAMDAAPLSVRGTA